MHADRRNVRLIGEIAGQPLSAALIDFADEIHDVTADTPAEVERLEFTLTVPADAPCASSERRRMPRGRRRPPELVWVGQVGARRS